MNPREITPRYHVSPQITPEDFPALKAAGYVRVICNRPDPENPPALQSAAMQIAADAAGMEFHVLELTHQTMTPQNVAAQMALVDEAAGPVLAYCASGTRCSVIWALGQVGKASTDEILTATSAAGYDLGGMRPTLEAMSR